MTSPESPYSLSARERKANQRARDQGLPEPFVKDKPKPEEIARRKDQHDVDLAWALEQDALPTYFKSEYRSCVELLGIYEGSVDSDKNHKQEDELTDRQKKARQRDNRLNPSQHKIKIRAVVHPLTGEKIEPDQDQFRDVYEVDEIVSFRRWLDLRDKARKDLLWLCRLVGKNPFHSVHQYVCDQFVQKNFDGMFFPGFTEDDLHKAIDKQVRYATDNKTPCKMLILLEPRGAYKTTLSGIDAIQWVINCPDIRVMLITAFKNLMTKALGAIKKYFFLEPRKDPSSFQMLFPEFVLFGVKGTSAGPLKCPVARFNQKEDTLWVTSMESSSTGLHCDVRKGDDVVELKNSVDPEMRADLKFKIDATGDILDQWSFSDFVGTRYFTDDWYGTRMLPNEDYVKEDGDETNGVEPYRLSCRGAWTLAPEVKLAYEKGDISVQDIIREKLGTLLFPFKLSWASLRKSFKEKGERSFKNQQLNEATDRFEDSPFINEFREEELRKHFRPVEFRKTCVEVYKIVQVWDTAYGEKATSDFSVGVTALIYKRDGIYRVLILDLIYDKWRSSELSFQILTFYKAWKPERIDIEKSNGSEHLLENIRLLAGKYGVPDIARAIHLVEPVTVPHAKRNRIKHIQSLLSQDRWDFINGPYMDEMLKQMLKFTGEKSTASRKDDIPDALSFVIRHLPFSEIALDADPNEVAEAEEKFRKREDVKALHDLMFSNGAYNNLSKASDWGGRKPPPPVTQEPPPVDPRRALLNRFFGGNGMRA